MSDLQRLSEGLIGLAEAWDATAVQCGDPTLPTSTCKFEADGLPDGIVEPDQLMRAIASDAVVYVCAASQQVRAIAALIGPNVVLTGWPLTRSVAELCGRVGWLLGFVDAPMSRVARFYMERISSTHFARLAAEKAGRRAHAKDLRKSRDLVLAQAKTMFPDVALFASLEEIGDWAIGGEAYAGLTATTNSFGGSQLKTKGLYDTLSAYTHPSIRRLQDQMNTHDLGDKQFQQFHADPVIIHWQVAVSCSSVYRAAGHVIAYLGIDDGPLEDWADMYEDLLQADDP